MMQFWMLHGIEIQKPTVKCNQKRSRRKAKLNKSYIQLKAIWKTATTRQNAIAMYDLKYEIWSKFTEIKYLSPRWRNKKL